ncbi:MAG: VanZ family protein [Bacteroidetes bacterium]|nr:VanZ family protein [Bacteroidota bacterium]
MPKRILLWLVYFCFLGLLTYLSFTPIAAKSLPPIPYFDKLAHTGFYLLLQGLFSLALFFEKQASFQKLVGTSAFFHIFYGTVIEAIQACFVPGRFGEWQDGLANTLGVLIGVLLSFELMKRFNKENEKN